MEVATSATLSPMTRLQRLKSWLHSATDDGVWVPESTDSGPSYVRRRPVKFDNTDAFRSFCEQLVAAPTDIAELSTHHLLSVSVDNRPIGGSPAEVAKQLSRATDRSSFVVYSTWGETEQQRLSIQFGNAPDAPFPTIMVPGWEDHPNEYLKSNFEAFAEMVDRHTVEIAQRKRGKGGSLLDPLDLAEQQRREHEKNVRTRASFWGALSGLAVAVLAALIEQLF